MHETTALGPMLGHCGHLGRERMEARLSQSGSDITPVQTHVLLYLHRYGGQALQCEVTQHLKVKPSTANGVLDRMEEKGLVERSVSMQEARRRLIEECNMFNRVASLIARHQAEYGDEHKPGKRYVLKGRHRLRLNPLNVLSEMRDNMRYWFMKRRAR